ncbi:hypothetical protein BJ170DRAFT_729047 [Xylariales sp. AK1849]|nr:hypothetical protein BJ170DRAFT_729047 [Xylariales sp. AK1849]
MSNGRDNLGGNSHTFNFPNRPLGQDGHVQNVIGNAHGLFPDSSFGLREPSLTSNADSSSHHVNYLDPTCEVPIVDDGQLDDFDRQVLGRPPASHYSHSHNLAIASPRISLPNCSTSSTRRPYVLGDASHHFRPFLPRSEDYQPQFPSNPINVDQLTPSPATRPILDRVDSRRVSELQPGSQLVTPPFYTAGQHQASPLNSVKSSSSSRTGSSPSARLSLRRQAPRAASRPSASQGSSNNVMLSLDHAPDDLTPRVGGAYLVNPRQALPDKCRAIFPYKLFNAVQSKCFPLVYGSNDNVVISAPTGSGKTAILELAICKLITTPGGENFKIVYQAPTKSLCSERARDWEKKFSHLNLRCAELTGDTSQAETHRVGSASIIVTTPEKWDSITRKWSDHHKLLKMVRLVLIDEVHILKDVRGATLEAVVSRMKTSGANVRFVALSATVPNIADIAAWLGRGHANQQEPAKWLGFGEEMRPVKLKKYVYGYDSPGNDFIFDKSMDGKLNLLLGQHGDGRPIMIFCFTRKSCEHTAKKLAEWWSASTPQEKAWPSPTQRIPVISKELQQIVRYGVAFHHAGLDVQDKASVETNYLNGQLHVICCTSTLAVGVNLPCHTVVLKGTTTWTDDGPQEYSDLEVMQMLGRAGRPQFDQSATAIIMTKRSMAQRYETMISGEEVLESKLHLNLIEHLNSEVGLGTIQDLVTAKTWIAGTFLSVRMRQAPEHYQPETSSGDTSSQTCQSPEDKLQAWCERGIELLQQYSLITTTDPFKCTEYGTAMSRYMIQFETMKLLLFIPSAPSLEELLISLSKAIEFKDLRFKPLEKALFRRVNHSVMYPLKETISDTWHKIYLMVQIHLGIIELPTDKDTGRLRRQIGVEKKLIFDRMNRLVRCIIDCKVHDGDGVGARVGLELARALAADSWEGQPTEIQQVPGLGPVAMRKLVSHGVRSVDDLAKQSFEDLERIMTKNPPYGKNILQCLDGFPRLRMAAALDDTLGIYTKTEGVITVTVKARLSYINAKVPSWRGRVPAATFLVVTTDDRLAFFWRNNIKKIDHTNGLELKFLVALNGPKEKIVCYFSCEEIVGTQVTETLTPSVPCSAFEVKSTRRRLVTSTPTQDLDIFDEFNNDGVVDDGDLADKDMLVALGTSKEAMLDSQQPNLASQSEEFDADFPNIDDILDDQVGEDDQSDSSPPGPIQMENGKWMCNHYCRGGGLTKNGKTCIHKCCHEGLDKPRRPPRKKTWGPISDGAVAEVQASQLPKVSNDHRKLTQGTAFSEQPRKMSLKRSKSISGTRDDQTKGARERHSSMSQPATSTSTKNRLKRTSSQLPMLADTRRAVKKSRPSYFSDNIDDDVDFIDLCTMADNDMEALQDPMQKSAIVTGEKETLGALQGRVQSQDIAPSRLTKPYKSMRMSNPLRLASGREEDELHYGSEVFDESDLPPELIDLVRSAEEVHEPESSHNRVNDETLYPGVVETYKESKGYVSELEKASRRFDLHTQYDEQVHGSLSLVAGLGRSSDSDTGFFGPCTDPTTECGLPDKPEDLLSASTEKFAAREALIFDMDPLQDAIDVQEQQSPQLDEPAWLSEMDPEIINLLRGHVDFID